MKLQKIGVDVEKINALGNSDDKRPEQLFGRRCGSPTSQPRQMVKTAPDQEYVRSMEERYGIREEGIF